MCPAYSLDLLRRLLPFALLVACGAAAAAAEAGSAPAQPRTADEIEGLVAQLRPPARFAGLRPAFAVTEESFTFQQVTGPRTATWRVVRDGERIVALITPRGIHLLSNRPDACPMTLRLPTGRWHIDTYLGAMVPTGSFIPGAISREPDPAYRDELTGAGGERLTLIRRFAGERSERQPRKDQPDEEILQRIRTTNTFSLHLDPIHGYVVDATYDTALSRPPTSHQFANLMCQGTYALWPGQQTSQRTVIARKGVPGFEGYAHNMQAIDRCDAGQVIIRDGGFGAYLDHTSGWSWAMTLGGGDARMVICNAHADIDFVVPWAPHAVADADGFSRLVIHHRLLALPPELTTHIWERMALRFADQRLVVIRIGRVEDFDDQPLSAGEAVAGLVHTAGMELSRAHARSGGQSLVVRGMVWPNIPQVALEPHSRYRLEGWYRVTDWSGPERQAARERHERDRERRLAKGEEAPPWQEPVGHAEAWISGNLYESSPHHGIWLVEQRTTCAVGGTAGWQHVTLEFTTPAYDPFIDVRFHCTHGTALLDDFALTRLGEAGAAGEHQPRP
jgi:hypothetical protein